MLNKLEDASASAEAMPSIAELREKLRVMRQSLDALVKERSSLSLKAILGHRASIERITTIDAERAELASMEETLNQAIVLARHENPAIEKHTRQLEAFKRDLPRLAKVLEAKMQNVVEHFTRYVTAALNQGQINQATALWGNSPSAAFSFISPDEVSSTEAIFKRLLNDAAKELCYVQDVDINVGFFEESRQPEKQRIRDAAIRMRDEMVAMLVATHPIKPPAHLVECRALFVRKLAALQASKR